MLEIGVMWSLALWACFSSNLKEKQQQQQQQHQIKQQTNEEEVRVAKLLIGNETCVA